MSVERNWKHRFAKPFFKEVPEEDWDTVEKDWDQIVENSEKSGGILRLLKHS